MAKITIDQLNDSMLTHFDKIYGKMEEFKQEQVFFGAGLKRVENDVAGLKSGMRRLEEKVDRIEQKLDEPVKLPAHA
jgi:hypothetical protein